MPLSIANGWGFSSSQFAATTPVAGVNQVNRNVGAGRSIVAGGSLRLTKLQYRIDLAPDVAVGAAVSPVYWRVFVLSGILPADLSIFQAQAFAAGSHPEIPLVQAGIGTPLPILHDIWLDLSAGDPGLNRLAEVEFTDAGPTIGVGETLSVLVVPILDANLPAVAGPVIAANAIVSVSAFGTGVTVNPQGGSGGASDGARSIPRFDVALMP
jgi:hypothetical protein